MFEEPDMKCYYWLTKACQCWQYSQLATWLLLLKNCERSSFSHGLRSRYRHLANRTKHTRRLWFWPIRSIISSSLVNYVQLLAFTIFLLYLSACVLSCLNDKRILIDWLIDMKIWRYLQNRKYITYCVANRWASTEPWPLVTRTENLVKSQMWSLRYASG